MFAHVIQVFVWQIKYFLLFDLTLSCFVGYIQACRALMIVALVLGLLSIVLALLGLKCTKLGSTSENTKGKMALTAGSLFILSGQCDVTQTHDTSLRFLSIKLSSRFHKHFIESKGFVMSWNIQSSVHWLVCSLPVLSVRCVCSRGSIVVRSSSRSGI